MRVIRCCASNEGSGKLNFWVSLIGIDENVLVESVSE